MTTLQSHQLTLFLKRSLLTELPMVTSRLIVDFQNKVFGSKANPTKNELIYKSTGGLHPVPSNTGPSIAATKDKQQSAISSSVTKLDSAGKKQENQFDINKAFAELEDLKNKMNTIKTTNPPEGAKTGTLIKQGVTSATVSPSTNLVTKSKSISGNPNAGFLHRSSLQDTTASKQGSNDITPLPLKSMVVEKPQFEFSPSKTGQDQSKKLPNSTNTRSDIGSPLTNKVKLTSPQKVPVVDNNKLVDLLSQSNPPLGPPVQQASANKDRLLKIKDSIDKHSQELLFAIDQFDRLASSNITGDKSVLLKQLLEQLKKSSLSYL